MFTGLVEQTGVLKSRTARGRGVALSVSHSPWDEPCRIGDSVAVQGVCLTLTRVAPGFFCCDVLQETLSKTTLGSLPIGSSVNLERALLAGDRMGGHMVSGHVDGIGTMEETACEGEDIVVRISCAADLHPFLAPKGSIACDGISLTIADLLPTCFTVHIVPHTWSVTSLRHSRPGDAINLEGDLLAKYVRRAVASLLPQLSVSECGSGLTEERMRDAGF